MYIYYANINAHICIYIKCICLFYTYKIAFIIYYLFYYLLFITHNKYAQNCYVNTNFYFVSD